MLFHVQYKGPAGWQSVGSGEAAGDDAAGLRLAIADLAALAGGLEPGLYRAMPAKGGASRWLTFRIGPDGSVLGDVRPADLGDGE